MRSFEAGSLDNIDTERAYSKAVRVLDESRFKEENFIDPKDPFSEKSVQRDLAHVSKKEHQFKLSETDIGIENKKFADILEAIILEHGELSEWFGPNAFTYKTSKYDDYENGVDALVEFRSEGSNKSASYVGLGIDITFKADTTDKFERLKKQIEEDKLTVVKYFHSEYTDFQGKLLNLPEVIIGADKNTIRELSELWLNKENKELGKHRVQIMILKQMVDQLRTFAMYAESIGKYKAQHIYLDRLENVRKILISKEALLREVAQDLNNDSVHYNITTFLEDWRREIERNRIQDTPDNNSSEDIDVSYYF